VSEKQISQLNLRLPSGLKDWLKNEAVENRRTATAEAIFILEMYRRAKESKNVFSGGL